MLHSTPQIRSAASLRTIFRTLSFVLGAMSFAFLLAGNVVAADSSDKSTKTTMDELTITAAKRGSQNVQDVPLTITALSGDTLNAMGADNFTDFAYVVPGLTFQDQGPGDKFYIIRGLQSAGRATTDVYFDA